ncbi:MAG: glycosyltransferase family 4 protein [Bacteroidetes bacterium]|nr:glycosyltransferase family 4 protein [Bacteroidota bacterium]
MNNPVTILFYSPFNQRSRDTESLMIAFKTQGHRVLSLSQSQGLLIHPFLSNYGVETYVCPAFKPGWLGHLTQLFFLIRFCRHLEVGVLYSHLESANFIASMAQYFMKVRVILCRHHSDLFHHLGLDKTLSYRLTNRLARIMIVYSANAKKHMIWHEGIPESRVIHINLAYNFDLYSWSPHLSRSLRTSWKEKLILVTAGSLTPLKRPLVSLELLSALRNRGVDARLILLGKGPLESSIKQKAIELSVQDHLWMPGYVDNVLEFLGAASWLIHPSISESSCVVVKEAGLTSTPAIVCHGIGDFDDYVENGVNGFRVNHDNFAADAVKVIMNYIHSDQLRINIGEQLGQVVKERFSIKTVLPAYAKLNQVK